MNKITIAILSFCTGIMVVVFALLIQKNIKWEKPDIPDFDKLLIEEKITWFGFGYKKKYAQTDNKITLYDEQTNLLSRFWSPISNKYNDKWYTRYTKELFNHSTPIIQDTSKEVTNLAMGMFDEKNYSKYIRIWRNFYSCCPTVIYYIDFDKNIKFIHVDSHKTGNANYIFVDNKIYGNYPDVASNYVEEIKTKEVQEYLSVYDECLKGKRKIQEGGYIGDLE